MGTRWEPLNGVQLKSVSCGTDFCLGVSMDNQIYARTGVNPIDCTGENPWELKEGTLKQVEVKVMHNNIGHASINEFRKPSFPSPEKQGKMGEKKQKKDNTKLWQNSLYDHAPKHFSATPTNGRKK